MLNAVLGLVNRKCVIMKENLPRMDSNHDKVIQSHAVENAKEVRERGECGRSKTNVLSNKLATKRTSNHKSLLISNLRPSAELETQPARNGDHLSGYR
jgi:hypothetical protein